MTPLQIAIQEIGNQEEPKGSNWGPHVRKYLESVNIPFPASWCMAFVYWCFDQTELKGKLYRSGGVFNVWNHMQANRVTDPQSGDIFIQDHGKGLGHTGIVESVEGDWIHTVEGNTNDTGSREGYEVCRRTRKISSCKGFIRIT